MESRLQAVRIRKRSRNLPPARLGPKAATAWNSRVRSTRRESDGCPLGVTASSLFAIELRRSSIHGNSGHRGDLRLKCPSLASRLRRHSSNCRTARSPDGLIR